MTVRRYDAAKLGKVEKTSHGFIRVPANLTRIGVLEYRDSTGNVTRELRHPDHVFSAESLATLEGVPVTDLHPPQFVSADNVTDLQVGFVSDIPRQDGEFVSAKLMIQRRDAVEAVLRGDRKEISLGYTCVPVPESGVWEGQAYDVIQTQIKYDHAAILPVGAGRAGSDVCMRLDSAHNQIIVVESGKMDPKDLEKAVQRADAAEAKIKELETQLGKLTAANEAANTALESFRAAERKDAREALETRARAVLGADAKFDGQTDRQVREAAIAKIQPTRKLDSLSDDFIAGAFEVVTGELPEGRNDALAAVRAAVEAPRTDGAVKTPAQVRAEAIAKRNNPWLKDTK